MKLLFLTLLTCGCMAAYAQNPSITLTAAPDGEKTLQLNFQTVSGTTSVSVDWGDGTPVAVPSVSAYSNPDAMPTNADGTPKGNGEIKIYGSDIAYFDCSYVAKAGIKISALDVSKAPTLKELNLSSHGLSSKVDLTKNVDLVKFTANNNLLETIDFTQNTELTDISMISNRLTSIDLSKNTKLKKIHFGGSATSANQLTSIDLTKNTELTSAYLLFNKIKEIDLSKNTKLTYISLNNNLLKTLDVTTLPSIKTVFCIQNQLTDVSVNTAVTQRFNFTRNKLVFQKMPPLVEGNSYFYAPQDTVIAIPSTIATGTAVDLSAFNNVKNAAGEAQTTAYTWKKSDGNALEENTDYTIADGRTTFLRIPGTDIYCEMSTPAYPLFTGSNTVKTSLLTVSQASSVASNVFERIKLTSEKGQLTISNLTPNDQIAVFTVGGKLWANLRNLQAEKTIKLPASGVYIISANEQTQKVVVK